MTFFLKLSGKLVFLVSLVLFFIFLIVYHTNKAMPVGTNFISKRFASKSENVKFLFDLTYQKNNKNIYEQKIFDTILANINQAQHYILIDMFLFNDLLGNTTDAYREISHELTQALINKKKNNPHIKIDFITDPINTVYGGRLSPEIELLKQNHINVIITNLQPLRDSNPLYSTIWHCFFSWFNNSIFHGWLPNPFSATVPPVTLRSYLSLLNFKANHRKIFVSDNQEEMLSLITSANSHNGSSAHSNVALQIKGDFWQSLWLSESAIAKMSNSHLQSPPILQTINKDNQGDENIFLELITEKQIKNKLLEAINHTQAKDQIKISMFYLSERDIINALLRASQKGVVIKIILDPNKDAFGYQKNGIPNRVVANELLKKSKQNIKIRWYNTHGEQFHTKLIYLSHKNGPTQIILGSANLTRRNIDNYNLETDVLITSPSSAIFVQNIETYFNRLWNNRDANYTLNYENYQETSWIKYWLYRLQEFSGLSSF